MSGVFWPGPEQAATMSPSCLDDVITRSPTCEFGCVVRVGTHEPPGRRQTQELPCGHAYCAPCSLRLVCIDREVPAVRCPLCRRLSLLARPKLVDVLAMLQEPIRHAGHQDASSMTKQAAVPPVHRLELVLPRFKFLHIFKKVSYEKLK